MIDWQHSNQAISETLNVSTIHEVDECVSAYPQSPLAAQSELAPYSFRWFDWFCFWYPPGWLILFNRHWQHYHDDRDGWNWLEYLLFLIPGGFYLALLLRWLRLGCRAPQAVDRAIDPRYQVAFRREILTPILKHYFRAELHQIENLPQTGSLLVTINHAGMCFPWDIVGLGVLLSENCDRLPQPVAHEIFFDHPWLRWWLPAGWSQILGGIRAKTEDFEAAVKRASLENKAIDLEQKQGSASAILYAPEGWRGLVKGWRYRYQLQTFDPSFIRLSNQYQLPILPVVCLGNEYLHPWTINLKRVARWLGMPIFPLSPLLLLFLLFPSMGVWANRTRLRYVIQPVQKTWEGQPSASKSWQVRTETYQKAQQMRSNLQSVIDRLRQRKAKP
ncbi:MAG TPA: 1-acyl-sn-glycerol-3-phosphate acyltransferase [Trichocoleus sp.]|jgi:1-acyl-sn-glycerol-3-phosphate acyltransferase